VLEREKELNLTEDKWHGLVGRPQFADYSVKYQESFAMRRENGIIELRMHRDGGPYAQTFATHNSWSQAWLEVGNDPENQVLVLTGTGDKWFDGRRSGEGHFDRSVADTAKVYEDGFKLLESFVFGIDIPTIAAVNGPGIHTEVALACDITICTEDSQFFDPHFLMGVAPGDGQALTFQELMGTKRAAYYMYTSKPIGARAALEAGLVSEVTSREQLLPRAWELAQAIMKRPRGARRLTHAIASRPWKQRLVSDFGFHLYGQAFGLFSDQDQAGVPAAGENLSDYPL
jgi:enoyl-CoA hydratase/carnithine racemase